jgi:regulator of protease activity HflC (stomatin/prohibitin superfamily)
MIRWFKLRRFERGFLFRDGEFVKMIGTGRHFFVDPLYRVRVDVVSIKDVELVHPDLEVIVKSGALAGDAEVIDLSDHERAVVWVDGRVEAVFKPGLHVFWTGFHDVKVEKSDARTVRFEHEDVTHVLVAKGARETLRSFHVEPGHVGLFFYEGRHTETVGPGTHAYWAGVGQVRVVIVDEREQVVDVSGQEIMTGDRVTLRLNAVVTYRVTDATKAVTAVEDYRQSLYREAQLAVRAVVGTKTLDELLESKDEVAKELVGVLRARVGFFGVEVHTLGIRDVILPGDMKELLNKVTEAKKAAEADLITRREEVASIRSQANTARMLESNPTLMRLRELEVLEKIASNTKMRVVVGEKGLTDRVIKLL